MCIRDSVNGVVHSVFYDKDSGEVEVRTELVKNNRQRVIGGGDAVFKLSRNASVSDGTAIGTIDFCNKVIEQKLDISFMVETHLNNLDDEMIGLLSKAGLELVYVGVESSSHVVLKDMQRFTVEHDKQYKVIKKCEDAGIKVKTMFIIGNPEDTEDTIIHSI